MNNANVAGSKTVSGADEISKFKALLDEGTITKEEFDAKKKQILGL
ncbi:SHOCT domain-containing protein [Oenococcus oeni]